MTTPTTDPSCKRCDNWLIGFEQRGDTCTECLANGDGHDHTSPEHEQHRERARELARLVQAAERDAARTDPEARSPEQAELNAVILPTAGVEYIVAHPHDPRPLDQQPRVRTLRRVAVTAHELATRYQRPIETWIWDTEHHELDGPYPYPYHGPRDPMPDRSP